jgi:quercetin dioxygenase-like cupin family protein
VAAWLTARDASIRPDRGDVETRLRDAGLEPRAFANDPGDRYGWHDHPRHKILVCVDGAITFHTREGDVLLEAGDRIDIEPGTPHAAHVHGEGVVCVEAYADGPDDLSASGTA